MHFTQFSGCTVHWVTEEVDCGPIVVQKTCDILDTDTSETLKVRVQALEGLAFIETIAAIHQGIIHLGDSNLGKKTKGETLISASGMLFSIN